MKHVLTIAGSDCSGGAGIQADLKTFSAFGVYGMSVVTAVTAQNTQGVRSSTSVSAELIAQQIDAIFEDIRVDAVKIGMLANAQAIEAVSAKLRQYRGPKIVADPVMISKNGHALMDRNAVEVFQKKLIPLVDVLTPNLDEVETLLGWLPQSVSEMTEAGRLLLAMGTQAAVVKGGHLEDNPDDVLVTKDSVTIFEGVRLSTLYSHGTGCSLSSAIAANLALGRSLVESIREAKEYVFQGIRHGEIIGKGINPIHHFWNLWPTTSSMEKAL